MRLLILLLPVTLLAVTLPALAQNDSMAQRLLAIKHQWAHIKYELPDNAKEAAFAKLEVRAAALVKRYPQRAEPKVWEAIVLSTHAGVHGGLSALPLVRKARNLLRAARDIDPIALHGAAYTMLGTLYYRVPGWPIGFGDDDKAEAYLKKAIALDPNGMDDNYFYADYLYRHDRYQAALTMLYKALHAPPRPNQPLADKGRRQEIHALIAKVEAER